MKIYSLMSLDCGLFLKGAKLKVNSEMKRTATLDLVVPMKTAFTDLPGCFRDTLAMMKEDTRIEKVELQHTIEDLMAQIFAAPDMKNASLAIQGVTLSDFSLVREKGVKKVSMEFKASLEYQEDKEAALWLVMNLGNTFFWELEDMQPPLPIDAPGDAVKAFPDAKKGSKARAKGSAAVN